MGKELKRMRYFDGLFLNEDDYKLDQEYQRRLGQLHNRYLHTWGIVDKLEVTPSIKATGQIITEVETTEAIVTEVVTERETYKIVVPKELTEEERCKIVISEGLAQNQVINKETGESISQQIYIPEISEFDLSGYASGQDIYVYVSYNETLESVSYKPKDLDLTIKEADLEKGKGQEIHIVECGQIAISNVKPSDEKEFIILARVELELEDDESETEDQSDPKVYLKYIKKISCYESNGTTALRTYAGPAGSVLALEKIIFKFGNEVKEMPFIRGLDQGAKGIGLEVDSPFTNFTGSVIVKGDLVVNGNLQNDNSIKETELLVSNSFVQVNSRSNTEEWKMQDGGLQVYRGEESETMPDACLMWSEEKQHWQVGFKYKKGDIEIDKDFFDIAYGDPWENLIRNVIVDDLHKHTKLSYAVDGVALETDYSGNLLMNGDLYLGDKTLWLRAKDNLSHGLGWFGNGKKFAGVELNGPVLFGLKGGVLGTTESKQKAVISWNSLGNVGIGVPSPIDDKLEVAGSIRILSSSNPIRFTSKYTDFSNTKLNDGSGIIKYPAEISNDTSSYKALMIIGNKSADQSVRKVAIWDRLDVNGLLYVNGNMQMSQAINPSIGNGVKNGIVFPSNPGGGGYDSAWIKYYARSGEACNLEIGTSNDANDNIALLASGNIGIGTVNPADKLDVNGNMRIMSGSNPIRFTSVWSGFPDIDISNVVNKAEISNDTTNYKSLMIAGNRSAKDGRRKVSIWDNLDVNGLLKVAGNLTTSCAIVPSVGDSENNGISFPKDYYGGSGDAAWIRYFSDTKRGGGENMTLEIGINNDPGTGAYNSVGDRIRLYASGGVYVDGNFYYSSSRDLKENIENLSTQKAKKILEGLNPVVFNFKGDKEKTTMGFIAEEVPTAVAAIDQKAISPMEIITVLTSVVKDQRKTISILQQQVEALS